MKKILLSAVLLFVSINAAWALSLQEARSQGLVIERADGYVEAAQLSPEVVALADEVNAKRKAEYERISKENGQPVEVVAKLAAEQIKKNQ